MAVATGREYGLFVDGEAIEPASGEVRRIKAGGPVGINMPFTAFPGIPFGG